MHPTFLNAVAIPESDEAPGELMARLGVIADDLAVRLEVPGVVDWEQVLDHGCGPGLALGVERRSQPR